MFNFCRKDYRNHFVRGPKDCIVDDDDYEGVFSKSFPLDLELAMKVFMVNKEDKYSFAAFDILIKLPSPDCGRLFT